MTIIDTKQATYYNQQMDELYEQKHPDIKKLEAFLKIKHLIGPSHKFRALELKHLAMTTIPTTIEKTMSPWQLYIANSPLWAVELTARGLEKFIIREKYNGKLPKIVFDDYYSNAIQGFYFDNNVDFDSLYPTTVTNLKKGT